MTLTGALGVEHLTQPSRVHLWQVREKPQNR